MAEELPRGFSWKRSGRLRLCVKDGAQEAVLSAYEATQGGDLWRAATAAGSGAVPASRAAGTMATGVMEGRGPVARLDLGHGSCGVLRRYRRGGLAGKLLPDLFFGAGRAMREIEVTERAREAGAPVPEALAAIFLPISFPPGVFQPPTAAWILTREIHDARPLVIALRASSREAADELLRAAARVAKACHDAGLIHADFNLGNILVASASASHHAWVIDLDRAHFRAGGATQMERFNSISRLARSHEKVFGTNGPWGADPAARLIEAYPADGPALKERLRALLPLHERALRRHRLAWKIYSVFGS